MMISIIIPTYKREAILLRTINLAMEAVEGLKAEVIVVNDGPEYEAIRLPESIIYLQNPRKGVSAARNHGFSNSSGDIIIFLDNDIWISKEVLVHLVEILNKNQNWILNPNWEYPTYLKENMKSTQFGRFLLQTGNYNYKAWAHEIDWGNGPLIEVDKLATFCLAMTRSVFEKLGGFNEEIYFGEEDLELTIRAKKMGYDLFVDESIHVLHNESDRVTITNKLQRMKIVGSMLSINKDFSYSTLKKGLLWVQSKFSRLLLSIIYLIPNFKIFDRLYFFLAHRMIANAIYQGYRKGSQNEHIENSYSKLKE